MKRLRLIVLVVILILVAHHQWNEKSRHLRWDAPLFVAVYPVAGDQSKAAAGAVEALHRDALTPISTHLQAEASRYGLEIPRPFYIEVGQPLAATPPPPPIAANFLHRAAWVARVRWWRWNFDEQGLDPDIVVLARYFDPQSNPVLPHSTGLQPIRLVIANLYAGPDWREPNQVVLLHEILHTLGATDKYDLVSGQPLYPQGYAEPERKPVHPQRRAELMAGRIPLSPGKAIQADSLSTTWIGPETAREIGWLND